MRNQWTSEKVINEIKFLEKRLGRRPVKRDNSALYGASRKFFGKWNNAMKTAGFEVKYYQYPKLPEELNEDLAYFLGLLITDGHIANHFPRRFYKVLLSTSYEEEKELILSLIKEIFNYNASVVKRKYGFNKRFNYMICICSKNLCNLLNQKYGIMAGNKSLSVRVPEIIFNSPNTIISNFLRGVIDGDGCIRKSSVDISSGSKLFLEDINDLIRIIGFDAGKIYRSKTCYRLNISYKENFKKVYYLLYKDAVYFYPRKMSSLRGNLFK